MNKRIEQIIEDFYSDMENETRNYQRPADYLADGRKYPVRNQKPGRAGDYYEIDKTF